MNDFFQQAVTNLTRALSLFVDYLNQVPNCRTCNGTGNPPDNFHTDWVYWKGQLVLVCANCKGSGKV